MISLPNGGGAINGLGESFSGPVHRKGELFGADWLKSKSFWAKDRADPKEFPRLCWKRVCRNAAWNCTLSAHSLASASMRLSHLGLARTTSMIAHITDTDV